MYQHITNSCQVTDSEILKILENIKPITENLEKQELPLFSLVEKADDLSEIESLAESIRSKFKKLVILGTGGSTLNGQAVTALSKSHILHFMDNVDPDTISSAFNKFNLMETCFLVISKSGSTLETISQFSVAVSKISDVLGEDAVADHFYIITDPKDSPLRRSGNMLKIPVLDHNPDIGGRFSTFTNVALLPAAVAGVDIKAFRKGASSVFRNLDKPATGAAINLLLMQKKISTTVLISYVDRLSAFTSWQRQIWSESLGKEGFGTTPIKATGTLDQHSQLQLYLDGQKDKMFTFLLLKQKGKGTPLNIENLAEPSFSYLTGKTMGDVMDASGRATMETVVRNNLPVRSFELEKLNEEVLGALMMHFILETVITAHIAEINPFDQPAVEEIKILAKKLLM